MKKLSLFLVVMGAGCTTTGDLISLKYCSRTSYLREGSQVHIEASCQVPVDASLLPMAIPIGK